MNPPAPDWPADPVAPAAPDAAAVAPPLPAAPPAPAPLASLGAPAAPQFAPPAAPEAVLDVTAPLAPIAPGHVEHPNSLAMPVVEQGHVAYAMPTCEAGFHAGPQPYGGIAAAQPMEPAEHASIAEEAAPEGSADPTGQWWSPGGALVLAFAALAWQLVAFFARVQLPIIEQSGTPLTNFDRVVGSIPLIDSEVGKFVGVAFAAAALASLFYGFRRGLREPALQAAVGVIAGLSVVAMALLPTLAG